MVEFDIRYSQYTDQKDLMKWLEDRNDLFYFPMQEKKDVEEVTRNWIGFSRYRSSLTATVEGKPCGVGTLFLMPYKKLAHHCTFYIIVEKKYRNMGIGISLLKNLLNLAKNYFHLEIINVETYEGCLLIPLLESFSFKKVAYQEKFVKKNGKYFARILYELFIKELKL